MGKKSSILEAATRSFAAFGYKATTMDQVAKLAKVGKGTIYTFFANKEELFQEIISDLISEMKSVADEEIDRNDSFSNNLHRALIRILDFREEHELTIKLFQELKEIGTPAVVEALQTLESEIVAFIAKEIQLAIEKGEIKQCDPKLTAFLMLKLYISLVFEWAENHEPLSKAKIAQLFEFCLMEGLAKN